MAISISNIYDFHVLRTFRYLMSIQIWLDRRFLDHSMLAILYDKCYYFTKHFNEYFADILICFQLNFVVTGNHLTWKIMLSGHTSHIPFLTVSIEVQILGHTNLYGVVQARAAAQDMSGSVFLL